MARTIVGFLTYSVSHKSATEGPEKRQSSRAEVGRSEAGWSEGGSGHEGIPMGYIVPLLDAPVQRV